MRREGTSNRPYYRIVVADQRSPRDGKFIEQVGTYDPKKKEDTSTLKLERIEHWIKNGARPSETVASFIKKARKAAPAAA
ncbi:MAG: 30S ribosomal protein S16 [Verrucomicrobium sp.]|nr:30S ribosomal protein S16 [Verrucomicrobium sp.]